MPQRTPCNFESVLLPYTNDKNLINLIRHMLIFSPENRITAKQALSHHYFRNKGETGKIFQLSSNIFSMHQNKTDFQILTDDFLYMEDILKCILIEASKYSHDIHLISYDFPRHDLSQVFSFGLMEKNLESMNNRITILKKKNNFMDENDIESTVS